MHYLMYLLHIIILIFIKNVTCAEKQRIQRTDLRFIDSNFPSEYESTHYTESEWNDIVSNNVNLSDFDNVQQQVKRRLESCGLRLDIYLETEIEIDNGRYRRIGLGSLDSIMNAVLIMYTLGYPLHNGSLFYPQFNRDTRAAIEKRMSSSKYDYFTEYALINQAFINKTADGTFYRGVNASFTFSPGDKVSFNQFTSGSTSFAVATRFIQSGGTIFGIRNSSSIPLASVSQYSNEREYLIAPFQIFTVGDVSEQIAPIWQITFVELL